MKPPGSAAVRSLASRCRAAFRSVDRERGEVVFRRRAVHDLRIHDSGVQARVQGSQVQPYEVRLSWGVSSSQDSPPKNGEPRIEASCTCPQFDDFGRCKHLWAVLLACEERGLGTRGLAERVPGDGALLLVDDRDGAAASPDGGSAAPWLRRLMDLGSSLAADAAGTGGRATGETPVRVPDELWYVINTEASRQRGGLFVGVYQRSRKPGGGFTAVKALPVHGRLLHALPEGEDRALLELLLSLAQPSRRPVDARAEWPRTESAVVPGALFESVVPRLAATGRLAWCAGGEPSLEDRLRWEPLAWTVRLRLERQEDGGVAVRGELTRPGVGVEIERGGDDRSADREVGRYGREGGAEGGGREEVRSIAEPVLLLQGGLVVFEDAVAPLEAPGGFGWVATLRRRGAIELPAGDVEAGLEGLWQLPSLPPLAGPEELIPRRERVPPTPRFRLRSLGRGGGGDSEGSKLVGELAFLYGDKRGGEAVEAGDQLRLQVFDARSGRFLERDRDAEARARRLLRELGLKRLSAFGDGASGLVVPAGRMVEVADRLLDAGWRVEAEGVPLRAGGELQLSVATGADWLDLRARVDFGELAEASAELPAILAAVRRQERFVTLGDGSRGLLPEEWLARFQGLARLADSEADGDSLHFLPSQALLLDLLLQDSVERAGGLGVDVAVDAGFERRRELLAEPGAAEAEGAPAGFRGELRPYQRVGLGWFRSLERAGIGGCLADDMGLGKTVQVLALLEGRREGGTVRRPSLVVAPRSLVFNWIEEAKRFAPQLAVADFSGSDRERVLEQMAGYDLVVTTYGVVRQEIEALEERRFDYVVLDEAQTVKNPGTKTARAVRRLVAEHRLALTGTPIENHLGELWSLLDFLNPGLLGEMGPKLIERSTGSSPLSDEELEVVARAARPFLLRRSKEEVLHELPPKTEQTLWCELGSRQRATYEELRDYYRVRVSERVEEVGVDQVRMLVLEALLRLRQAACHPALIDEESAVPSAKVGLLVEQLEELREEGHKAIVFSQFTKLLALVRGRLDESGIEWEQLDGRTRNRRAKVERFQEDPECGVFLVSLKAGGTGLNLTAAHYVFLLDPWWNPAVEAQAIDRAHRMGQTQPVFAYRLIARDTVEEKILALQRHKRRLADAILAADASTMRGLTAEEVAELLG